MPPYPSPSSYKVVQFRRGSTTDNEALLGAQGEITVDLDKKTAVVHDGIQIGGFPLRRDDVEVAREYFISYKAVVVQNGIPFLGLSTGNNPPTPVIAVSSGPIVIGVAEFSPLVGQSIQGNFTIPDNWPSSDITCQILWRTIDLVNPITWTIEAAGISDGQTIQNFTFDEIQIFPNYVPTVSNELITSIVTLSVDDNLSGVVPSGELFFRLARGFDSSPQVADLFSVRFNVERLSQ